MRSIALVFALVSLTAVATTACGGKKYLPPPQERPGELEPINPGVQDTDQRAPYSVDVPIQ